MSQNGTNFELARVETVRIHNALHLGNGLVLIYFHSIIQSLIPQSLLRQFHSPFQSQFCIQCDLVCHV